MITLKEKLAAAGISHAQVALRAGCTRGYVTQQLFENKPIERVQNAAEELLAERPADLIIEARRLLTLNQSAEGGPPQKAETTKAQTGLRADGTEQARCYAVTAEAVERTLFFATLEMASDPAWPGDINPDATPGGRHLLGLDLIDADGAITDAGRAIHAALTGGQDTRRLDADDDRQLLDAVRLIDKARADGLLTVVGIFKDHTAEGRVAKLTALRELCPMIEHNPQRAMTDTILGTADDIRKHIAAQGDEAEPLGVVGACEAADAIIAAQPSEAPAPLLPGESAADAFIRQTGMGGGDDD